MNALDDIVVSASRISASGYAQPTPVTVVDEEVLLRDFKPSIGDSLRELPAISGGMSPFTQGAGGIVAGTAGLDTVDLRQLGSSRTLVLFDGQRVAQSVVTGQVDIGTMPSILVQRVEVVTGGASAAWGSDAVSGVVNLVLNKKFQGVRASADYGNTDEWDHKNYRFQLAAGTDFADGRGHIIGAANYVNSPEVVFAGQRSWNSYRQLLPNPAYTASNDEPRYIHVDNVGLSQATTGGLVLGHFAANGSRVTSGSPFRGIQFVGPDAAVESFDFGIVRGPISGNGSAETLNASINNLSVGFRSTTLFGYSSYELTDNIRASLQLNYGTTFSKNSSVPNTAFGSLRVERDNAFLPASVGADMDAAGVGALLMGTTHLNNLVYGPDDYSFRVFENTVGIPVGIIDRELKRAVVSLDGDLGNSWKWDAYVQVGRNNMYQTTTNNNISANLAAAMDAVFAPAGNAAGVPAGTIVCRSTLTTPGDGCVPLNIFGIGVASPEAVRYVNVVPGENFQDQTFRQTVFAATLQGELPFGLPAGPITTAFGIEHRREHGRTETDGGVATRRYALGNFAEFNGKYDVNEGFVEFGVPLLTDKWVESVALNAAWRATDYSTSGLVHTWKVGLTSQLDDNIRLRTTMSRDIRAPNLNELFSQGVATTSSAIDPRTGINEFIYSFSSGNPDLKPEIGRTFSVGMVLTPSFAPRLTAALDFYNIKLTDAIGSINAATVNQRCRNGEQQYCAQHVFGGPGGALNQINVFPLNLSSQTARGVDFQADYSMPLLAGDLSFRLLGNYIMKMTSEQFGVVRRCDESMGLDGGCNTVPSLRANLSATYDLGKASFTVQERFLGSTKLARDWTSKDVDTNKVSAVGYVDLRASYFVRDEIQVFGSVDNLLDKDPPNIPAGATTSGAGTYYSAAVRSEIWDTLGRAFRVGVRLQF